uniref:Putative secreted protein n=1 Tax=Anopheles marajoara TaxID=58244 RepID=A0A2M4CA07_9DIPT
MCEFCGYVLQLILNFRFATHACAISLSTLPSCGHGQFCDEKLCPVFVPLLHHHLGSLLRLILNHICTPHLYCRLDSCKPVGLTYKYAFRVKSL